MRTYLFGSANDLPQAFAAIEQARSQALIVKNNSLTYEHRAAIIETSKRLRIPDMYEARELVAAGGLVSYGPNVTDLYRQAAGYVDRIFKGAKPADLPVQQPTKFDLVLNLKTAKAIGLTIPQSLLLRADEGYSVAESPASLTNSLCSRAGSHRNHLQETTRPSGARATPKMKSRASPNALTSQSFRPWRGVDRE